LHTPSLVTRVVVAGGALVLALALGLDLLIYVTLSGALRENINKSLDSAVLLLTAEVAHEPIEVVPGRVASVGIRVTVRDAQGNVVAGPPISLGDDAKHLTTRTVVLTPELTADVAVSSQDRDISLARLRRLELVVTPLVAGLALLLLKLIGEIAVLPLGRIADAARRTAEGQRGERLRPYPSHNRLGRMATAYDDMLDALEAALAEARDAQAQSERLLERDRLILETARDAFVGMDENGLIIDWNAEAERTFGWAREEVIGRSAAATLVPEELRPAHEEGLQPILRWGGTNIVGRRVEVAALRRDGGRIPVELAVWRVHHEGLVTANAFIRDVTEEKAAQAAIARLAAIVESSDEAILSTTLDGVILTWNSGAERMYGYTASEAVGRDMSLIAPGELSDLVEETLEGVRNGTRVQRVEEVRRCKSGTLIDVALTISPVVDSTGAIIGASSVGRDITEQRWLAAQLDATLAKLEKAVDEAHASGAATRRFLDDAAHQLRTPITTIRASAELLVRGGMAAEDRDRLLGSLIRHSASASRMMAGLLRMARLNQGTELVRRPCDLAALCRVEVERLATLMPGIDVVVTAADEPLGWPALDSEAVSEILSNVIDNARRHAASRIDIDVSQSEGQVEVAVTDDGPGVPEEHVDSIFERFVSIDGRGGSGLGLAIARGLAQAHGGDLSYENKAFVLRLPDAVSPDAEPSLSLPS
jgi:PAS domain S-box-containing protein